MAIRVPLNTDPSVVLHGAARNATLEKYGHVARKSHGRLIHVGAPEKPGTNWKCGTDLVWPVIDKAILRETERSLAYVCRHQIIIGD
jgi:hypothetical protein